METFEDVLHGLTCEGSYRTYEEWKRGEINETLQEGLEFLPYL